MCCSLAYFNAKIKALAPSSLISVSRSISRLRFWFVVIAPANLIAPSSSSLLFDKSKTFIEHVGFARISETL